MFVRGTGGWITCPWKYLEKVPAPFGELAWDHVSGRLAAQGQGNPTEMERAQAVDDLLRRAYHGPPDDTRAEAADEARTPRRGGRQLSARDRRVAARTRAAATSPPLAGAGAPAAHLATPERCRSLDGLLQVDPELGAARATRLRRLAVQASPPAMHDEMDKVGFLRGLGAASCRAGS